MDHSPPLRSTAARLVAGWLLLALLLLSACQQPAASPLRHEAYIWQRQWTPALAQALAQATPAISRWRVLVAQSDEHGRLHRFAADRQALRDSGRPLLLVVRIDGQLARWDQAVLLADTIALWRAWQLSGLPLDGLEIDYDCATARLPAYTAYLAALRARLVGARLSITALPAWLRAPAPLLAQLLAQVDESVLQLHAVRDPRAGLFDPALARAWAGDYAARSPRPFYLALPTYGSRVSWDASGQLADVRSEATTLDGADDARELLAMPTQIADFLADLCRDPPPHLRGIAWFRLPTAQDRRAWSLPTWLALIRGESPRGELTVQVRPSTAAGTQELWLDNRGVLDAALPRRIELPADCALADGFNGYTLDRHSGRLWLQRDQPGLLGGRRRQSIGWARCPHDTMDLHVET